MVDQNPNPEDFNGNLGPFDKGTTDINSFLPFQGDNRSYKPIITPSPAQRVAPNANLDNSMYPIKDSITGLPPYTDAVPKVGKMTAQQKAAAFTNYTFNQLKAFEDKEVYAPIQSYDPSANGAHRARYLAYGQKTFDKVGFNPLINNEALFNANTDILDDFSRTMTSSFFPLFGRGVIANPKSYAGVFTGDFGQDVAEAAAYEDFHSIGYSSKGGVGAFLNNTLNSFAYTAGILVEAAVEEALIGAALGSRGGAQGAATGTAIGAGAGVLKGLFQVPKALYSMTKNGATIMANLKNLDNVNDARVAFKEASKVVGNFLNPVENIGNAFKNDILSNANNLGKLARAKNTFAGFYLDVRNMNMALSEARLEGGFVENNTYKQLYDDYYIKNGEAPSTEKQKEFRQTAKQAGADALMYNSGLIFYSNKLVVPTLMRGSLLKNMTNYSENIIDVGKKARVILGKKGFEAVDINFTNSLKALRNPAVYGRTAAAYFKANVTEGLQENFQDVIADYTQKRYVEAYNDPAKMNFDFKKGLIKDALLKQISPEGFEAFASGFIMGGYSKVLTGGYNLLTDNYLKYVKDPKGYADTIKERKETAESIAKRLNVLYENPKDFFHARYFNYGHQVLISKVQDSENVTLKESTDAVDDSFITNLTTILKTGTMRHFVDNFEKLKQLTPEELETELSLAPGEGAKALSRIDTIISRAKRMEKRYEAAMKMQSGINLNDYKEGTDEYRKAALLDEAFSVSRANLVFMGESFDRNLERIQSISNEVLNLVNKSDKIAASDIMAITSNDRMDNELNILETEIESLKNSTDPQALKKVQETEDKVQKLKSVKNALAALEPANFAINVSNEILSSLEESAAEEDIKKAIEDNFANKAEEMSKEIVENVKNSLIDYLKAVTGGTTDYEMLMNKLSTAEGVNSIDSLVTSVIDIRMLDRETAALASVVTALSDPEEFLEHVNRNFQWMRNMYNNRSEYFKDVVNTSIEQKEYNDLLEKLAEKGIYVDLDEFAEWIEDKTKLPTQFEDDINKRIITPDTPLYREYISLFMELADIQKEKPAGEKANADELLKEKIAEEDEKMQKELDEARKLYDQELKKEIGFTEKELEDLKEQAVDTTEQDKEVAEMLELIDNIEALGLQTEEDAVSQQVLIQEAFTKFGLTPEALEAKNNEIAADKERARAAVNLSKADSNVELFRTPEGRNFIFYRVAVPELLREKVETLQAEIEKAKESQVQSDIDVNATEAKKSYDAKVAEITAKYDKIKADLVEEYGKQGAKATDVDSAKAYVKVTTETPWDSLPEDLKADLQKMFDKHKKENFKSEKDPARLALLRQNWLKTQGPYIEAYNTSKAGERPTDEVLVTEPPVLTFKAKTPEELKTSNLGDLSKLIKDMQFMFSEKKIIDAKEKVKTLTKSQLEKLGKEIKALQGYLAYRRSIADISSPEGQILETIQNLIKDAAENVEVIKNERGQTVGRRIKGIDYAEGEYAARVTSEKERVLKSINPDYEVYEYNALKDEMVTDPATGQIVRKPSRIESIFKRVEVLTADDSAEVKVDNFISQLKSAFAKKEIQKFGVQWKYDRIKDYFLGAEPKEFNLENVKEIIAELANKESSETGTLIDSLSRDYLAGKKITQPKTMTERGFKNLKTTLDKVLDLAKDGKVVIVPKDILLYSRDYVSEDGKKGLTGEIDLLLIDSDGNFFIVDFKTGKSSVWTNFNKTDETIDLTEAYTWPTNATKPLTDNTDVINWEELGYESFEEFNQSYNNDVQSISLLSTEGANKKGIINGTIKVFFKQGAGKKAINLDVQFVKPTYTIVPKFSRKPEYATQLSFYRNLFANMTGIVPKGIRILPIETKINEEAQIESLELASIANPETGFIDVDFVEQVNNFLPLNLAKASTTKKVVTATDKKADIERRRQEELNKLKENLENDLKEAEKEPDTAPKVKIKKADGSIDTNSIRQNSIESANSRYAYGLNRTNAKYDAELAALEGVDEEDQNIYEEYIPESYDIKDNVNQTVLYNGEIGTLIEFQSDISNYAVETPDGIYPIDISTDSNILKLGINTIKLNQQIFNEPVINGKTYKIDKIDDNTYSVNGIEYTVEKFPRKKGIKNLRYRSNDEKIAKTQTEITAVTQKYNDLLAKSDSLTDDERIIQGLQLVQQLASMEYKLNFLQKTLDDLIETNTEVISKSKDLINAIQSLPEFFANSTTSDQENEDLEDIKNKSDNSAAIQDMYDIMVESVPANFDKLLTDIPSLTKEDLNNFVSYINSIIPKLEQLKLEYEGIDRMTTNISNEIVVLGQLLNYITNIKTNKDGRVSKSQPAEVKREQERLQQNVDESALQESQRGQAESVSGQQAQQKRRGKVNSDILQPMIYNFLAEEATEDVSEEVEQIDLEEINNLFENATQETLVDVYFDTIEKLSKKGVPSTYADKLYNQKVKEFATEVSAKTVEKADTLIRKNDNVLFIVTDVVNEGVDVVNYSTKETMFISNKDLKNKYLKHYTNLEMEEMPVEEVFDDSDNSASDETFESLEDAINDPDIVQSKVDEMSQLSKEERRNRLRNNTKCD